MRHGWNKQQVIWPAGAAAFFGALAWNASTPAFISMLVDSPVLGVGMPVRAMRLLRILIASLVCCVAVIKLTRPGPEVIRIAASLHVTRMAHVMAVMDLTFGKGVRKPVSAPVLVPAAHLTVAVSLDEALIEPAAIGVNNASRPQAIQILSIRQGEMSRHLSHSVTCPTRLILRGVRRLDSRLL